MAFSKFSLIKIKLGKDAYLTKQFTIDMFKCLLLKGYSEDVLVVLACWQSR